MCRRFTACSSASSILSNVQDIKKAAMSAPTFTVAEVAEGGKTAKSPKASKPAAKKKQKFYPLSLAEKLESGEKKITVCEKRNCSNKKLEVKMAQTNKNYGRQYLTCNNTKGDAPDKEFPGHGFAAWVQDKVTPEEYNGMHAECKAFYDKKTGKGSCALVNHLCYPRENSVACSWVRDEAA